MSIAELNSKSCLLVYEVRGSLMQPEFALSVVKIGRGVKLITTSSQIWPL
jgi:hypothetical protein